MDESEQRRERLKAMRMEASQEATTYNDGSNHSAVSLSNPLLESTAKNDNQVQSFAHSFNYYTDPMAAYSGNKQRSEVSPQIVHDYSSTSQTGLETNETFPSPSLQPHITYLRNPQMQQPQGQYANPNYAYTPNRPPSGNFPGPSWNNNSPHPGSYLGQARGSGQGYYPSPVPSPRFSNSPGHGSGQGYYPSPVPSPRFSNSPGHGSGQGYPSPNPNYSNSPNHSSGPNQGRGHWFGNNMNSGPSSGRGRGRWSGQGGGRGQGRGGAHNHVTAEDRPDLFYNRSMVEDPWKLLEPVIWKSYRKQWFPHSMGVKKARVSESPKQSSSQPSLAEILAASFNEAAKDESNAA